MRKFLEIVDNKIVNIYSGKDKPNLDVLEVPYMSTYVKNDDIREYKNDVKLIPNIEILGEILKDFPNSTVILDGNVLVYSDAITQVDVDAIAKKIEFDTVKGGLEQAISDHIHSKIDEYNKANNLSFKDIDSLVKYTRIKTYSHYRFVIKALTWNVKVWEFARQVMDDVIAGKMAIPTKQELIDALPKLVY